MQASPLLVVRILVEKVGASPTVDVVSRIVYHLDLDAFFASVERALRPELAHQPVAVSAPRGQAMVVTATYDAKRCGVKLGSTRSDALRLCPNLVFVTSRPAAYSLVSQRVHRIVEQWTEAYETLGLDECFIDARDITLREGDEQLALSLGLVLEGPDWHDKAAIFGTVIRHQIERELGVTASFGAASSKIAAKLATELGKPDGMRILRPDEELEQLQSQRIQDITGIGPRSVRKLVPLGVSVVRDLLPFTLDALVTLTGKHQGGNLYRLARNELDDSVVPNPSAKTMASTRSLRYFDTDPELVFEGLLTELLDRLRRTGRGTRFVSVVVASESAQWTRGIDHRSPVGDLRQLAAAARSLFAARPAAIVPTYVGVIFTQLSDHVQYALELPGLGTLLNAVDPPLFEAPSDSDRLLRHLHRGLVVAHPVYGTGIVDALDRTGVVVSFGDVVRTFDPSAPLWFDTMEGDRSLDLMRMR